MPYEEFVRELRDVIARPQPNHPEPVAAPPERLSDRQVGLHPLDTFGRARESIPAPARPIRRRRFREFFSLVPWFLGAGLVIAGLLYVSQYGFRAKGRVIEQGNAAIGHMLAAKADLEGLDFSSAQTELENAHREFQKAGNQLGLFGPLATNLLSMLPGLGNLDAGHDLLRAGELLSSAGLDISHAVAMLGKAGESSPDATDVVFTEALDSLDDALGGAREKIEEAGTLLAGIDPKDVPEEFRTQLASFSDRLPAIEALVDQGGDAVAFVRLFMGEDRPRRYLVLFQNSSELRPTGGFPGSYGLLTTERGRIKDWRADDIYNPDGQIKQLIVPPVQLQHITPGWGMRDANWFIDFSASAREVMEYWRRGGGEAVDGVLAIRPDVLAAILEVIGPVSLPDYDVVLDADNVLSALQTEIEENRPTGKPKQIITDLAPLVLDRLATLPADRRPALLAGFAGALDRRDILMSFTDREMQEFADARKWSGRVDDAPGDYLMVTVSNIAGAKTDAVTDTALKLESRLQGSTLVHRLTITRQHNGGSTEHAFYNKTNKSYVRVLVPQGSTLRGIEGNDRPYHRPIMNYAAAGAVRDPDIEALEATYQYDQPRDLVVYEESGKTGFGFWMKVEPGATQQIQLEYAVPAAVSGGQYRLFIQRQPGLDVSDFELTFDKPGLMVSDSKPALVQWPDSWRLHADLSHDLNLEATLR